MQFVIFSDRLCRLCCETEKSYKIGMQLVSFQDEEVTT